MSEPAITIDEAAEIVADLMPIGSESRQAQALTLYVRAIEANKLRTIELAYGLLWMMPVNTRTDAGLAAALARQALLAQLDRAGQARGIEAAAAAIGEARKNRALNNSQPESIPER